VRLLCITHPCILNIEQSDYTACLATVFFIYFCPWRKHKASQVSVHHVTAKLASWGCDPVNRSCWWGGIDRRVKGRSRYSKPTLIMLSTTYQVISVTNPWTFLSTARIQTSSGKE